MSLDHASTDLRATAVPETARYVLHAHRDTEAWAWAAAVCIAGELRRELQNRPRVRLLLAADTGLAQVYRVLSKAPLDWHRVDVTLIDELWLLPDDPDSHARFLRQNLLQNLAAAARLEPLTQAGRRIGDAVAIANNYARQPTSVLVLAMGADGRIGSLVPGSFGLRAVLESRVPYAAIDPGIDAAPGEFGPRIGLTPAGLANAHSCLLLLRGAPSRAALATAMSSSEVAQWPIVAALDTQHGRPLHVHWCA
ncbi:6-phosphogluconolactonase [Montanilutibacter psychrotolerans]|uniref:6-phosphogluconolactonase n=1 Tax=Montanilutibacter psychrotolerans TaxID=1327343 RepID=A0A3M8SPC3_9GAMM|nr:6-phosphogluconolactonase [Lysobacter psychrotolerans]RNF83161.1 6-phosphogluconolactonase [Lysobacter psychrotolerans]